MRDEESPDLLNSRWSHSGPEQRGLSLGNILVRRIVDRFEFLWKKAVPLLWEFGEFVHDRILIRAAAVSLSSSTSTSESQGHQRFRLPLRGADRQVEPSRYPDVRSLDRYCRTLENIRRLTHKSTSDASTIKPFKTRDRTPIYRSRPI